MHLTCKYLVLGCFPKSFCGYRRLSKSAVKFKAHKRCPYSLESAEMQQGAVRYHGHDVQCLLDFLVTYKPGGILDVPWQR
jgi:hypothetical protein